MDANELVTQAERIRQAALTEGKGVGAYAQAVEFLKKHGGTGSAFLERLVNIEDRKKNRDNQAGEITASIMSAFSEYAGSGLFEGADKPKPAPLPEAVAAPEPVKREPAFDYLGCIFEKADRLINDENAHVAAPVPLIGCALELYLKKLVEKNRLPIDGDGPEISRCGQSLLKAGLISGTDMKDINRWSAMAAESDMGRFDGLGDVDTITKMLQEVRAFVTKDMRDRGVSAARNNK